ncbi:MAG: winged helix DNA-binding domain-containing protein, partial [Actinomycetota bacterium]|nr:winged helix DNA-binding domain-containing protein [Actinomycetota bacterium]
MRGADSPDRSNPALGEQLSCNVTHRLLPSAKLLSPAARHTMSGALSWTSVLAWRMSSQHLRARAPRSAMLDVVSDIAGAHAQLMSSAELTLWARVESLERGMVEKALWEERTLVKTWAMRGTLHLLPAHELPLWVAAQAALKPRHENASWLRYFGLNREEAEALLAAIPQALDGRVLTREELAREVGRRMSSPALAEKLRESWGALLKPSAFRGDLCFAPSEGRNVCFARPNEWLASWEEVPSDVAIRDVVRRYLTAYGPAGREEFARWFGARSPAEAERLIRRLGDEVTRV